MAKWKKCPFCGGSAVMRQDYNSKKCCYFVYVKCEICGAQGQIFNSNTDADTEEWGNYACYMAEKAWNRRTES